MAADPPPTRRPAGVQQPGAPMPLAPAPATAPRPLGRRRGPGPPLRFSDAAPFPDQAGGAGAGSPHSGTPSEPPARGATPGRLPC